MRWVLLVLLVALVVLIVLFGSSLAAAVQSQAENQQRQEEWKFIKG